MSATTIERPPDRQAEIRERLEREAATWCCWGIVQGIAQYDWSKGWRS